MCKNQKLRLFAKILRKKVHFLISKRLCLYPFQFTLQFFEIKCFNYMNDQLKWSIGFNRTSVKFELKFDSFSNTPNPIKSYGFFLN